MVGDAVVSLVEMSIKVHVHVERGAWRLEVMEVELHRGDERMEKRESGPDLLSGIFRHFQSCLSPTFPAPTL